MTVYVSHSGGLDSTAALLKAMEQSTDVVSVAVRYGQRHQVELQAAADIADTLGVRRGEVDITGMLRRGPSLVEGGAVPHGHYAEDSMSATVVQGRNLAFVAAILGSTKPGDQVWLGVHGGDHYIYPDCRPDFIEPLATAIRHAYQVELMAPFLYADKTEVARTFALWPHIAALTWSCYEGGVRHCGRCGTCVERAEAFDLAGVHDPTIYADPDYWRQAVASRL